MEDSCSVKSSDSLVISDEFEIICPVGKTLNYQLPIGTDSGDFEQTMNEALSEADSGKMAKRKDGNRLTVDTNIPSGLDLCREISDLNICEMNVKLESFQNANNDKQDLSTSKKTEDTSMNECDSSCRLVGGSKFYNVLQEGDAQEDAALKNDLQEEETVSPISPGPEKQDCMKPTESDEEVSDVDQECTVFSGVCYLGAVAITQPRSEPEIQATMATLSAQRESQTGIAVSVSIPTCSQGLVVLYEGGTGAVMARYAVRRILFYARGAAGSPERACFAFTWAHGSGASSAVFRCHVFRCRIPDAVAHVSGCFARAFERVPRSMTSSMAGSLGPAGLAGALAPAGDACSIQGVSETEGQQTNTRILQSMHVLECTVDIREADAKGAFSAVPKERLGWKLRAGVDKQLVITIQQVNSNSQHSTNTFSSGGLVIERCFGILVGAGRNLKHSDMQLLEMVTSQTRNSGSACTVSGLWSACETALAALSHPDGLEPATTEPWTEYMTLAVDLVIRGIPDPLRLVMETPVKIYPPTERFWYFSKRPLVQQFFINLNESVETSGCVSYTVSSVETSGELDRSRVNLTLSLYSLLPSPLAPSQPQPNAPSPDEEVSDGEEPLLSGTGSVSKDCCEGVLESWAQVLRSWTSNNITVGGAPGSADVLGMPGSGARPKQLASLVRHGIPEALRGEVWQRLAEADRHQHLMDTYRVLIAKECPCESVIRRDIARTFPAHDHFREAGGLGQDSLLRLARAYALYDEEVGYCQGLSFVAATLLLHMPEEQAFCVLVRLMYGYGLRELYKDGFEALYMRLYQLHRLMEEQMGDLRHHFQVMGVETHMFASQWFLTLFTARFPLPLVFHIVDVFLLQGIDTLFQIALALLSKSKKDLLQTDFEGILKYFRVTLPKKCRTEEVARQIVKHACSIKVKRLPKYQLEFENLTKEQVETEKMDNELEQLRSNNTQLQLEKSSFETAIASMRESCERSQRDAERSATVARDYQVIAARLDAELHATRSAVQHCKACSTAIAQANTTNMPLLDGATDVSTTNSVDVLRSRVRELELELAQTKLAHVQAQCSNQELSHRLTHLAHINASTKQAWPPWLSKTIGSIKEAAQNSRPTFQTYLPNLTNTEKELASTQQPIRRHDSLPISNHSDSDNRRANVPKENHNSKRHSMMADMGSANRGVKETELREISRRSQDLDIISNSSMG